MWSRDDLMTPDSNELLNFWNILVLALGIQIEQPFMKMNSKCFITYKTLYSCDDIYKIIDYLS